MGHILKNAGDRGELMVDAVNLDGGNGRSLKRGKDNAAKRVAERVAPSALKRTDIHFGVSRRLGFFIDHDTFRHFKIFQIHGKTPLNSGEDLSENQRLHAAALARTAAVVGNGRGVADGGDSHTGGLKSAHCRFTSGAGAADFDFHFAHAVLHSDGGGF